MTLVATVVLIEVDEPDIMHAGLLTRDNAATMKEAVEALMPDGSLIVAIMNPGDASAMLDSYLRTVKTTTFQLHDRPTGPIH